MQIRRSEKCVWQNRTAEREENDLGLQDDRMSGNIQDIARLITRLLLKGDMPQATDEEIVEAAKKAHAHKFIIQLKGGYDAMLAEEGSDLSQGQRQLLSIARIMLANPPMLILDEATSSIDTRTERQIQDAFDTMMIGRTTFIVAHRLSTIQKADQIIVMNDGHIIEQGKHEELLKKNGFYHNLYYSQFEKPE